MKATIAYAGDKKEVTPKPRCKDPRTKQIEAWRLAWKTMSSTEDEEENSFDSNEGESTSSSSEETESSNGGDDEVSDDDGSDDARWNESW